MELVKFKTVAFVFHINEGLVTPSDSTRDLQVSVIDWEPYLQSQSITPDGKNLVVVISFRQIAKES